MNQEGLSREEQNQAANEYLDKALYNESYVELHREIYQFYDTKLNNNRNKHKEMEKHESELDEKLAKAA